MEAGSVHVSILRDAHTTSSCALLRMTAAFVFWCSGQDVCLSSPCFDTLLPNDQIPPTMVLRVLLRHRRFRGRLPCRVRLTDCSVSSFALSRPPSLRVA